MPLFFLRKKSQFHKSQKEEQKDSLWKRMTSEETYRCSFLQQWDFSRTQSLAKKKGIFLHMKEPFMLKPINCFYSFSPCILHFVSKDIIESRFYYDSSIPFSFLPI